MPDRVGQCEVETIVRDLLQLHRSAHLKSETAADCHKRDVVQRVAVAFAQFITGIPGSGVYANRSNR